MKPLAMSILAIFLSVLSVEKYLFKYQSDHTFLVLMSANRPHPSGTEHFLRMADGYDGQYYFLISQSPFQVQPEGYLDSPARHTRILYCIVCWLFSGFGNRIALVWAMYVVNLLFVGGTAYLATEWATKKGCPSWWGLLVGLSTNSILSLLRNLTDVSSTFCLVGLLFAWVSHSRTWVILLWATATVFAKEQNVAVVSCLFLLAAWNRKWKLSLGLGIVCVLWAGFFALLWYGYGEKPLLPSEGNLGPPFEGYSIHFQRYFYPIKKIGKMERTNFYLVLQLPLMIFLGLYLAIKARSWVLLIPILLGAVLVVVSGNAVYNDVWSYGRVFNLLPISVWFAAVERRWFWYPILCVPSLILLAAVI